MKNVLVLVLLGFFTVQIGWAQSGKGKIVGQIVDEQQNPIPYATISLYHTNQELVQGGISNDDGTFLLEKLPYATYQIEIQFLGYQTWTQQIELSKQQKKINLSEIRLEEDVAQLDEVVVTAEKSQYSIRMDKRVFEVGKDVLTQGGSAMDILDQVPQVSAEPGGAVTLRGSSQVQILVNGRRSGLTLNNALDQIDANQIARIEVITNPSASFDANGSAGIINIVLKKNKRAGLSGQLRAEVGTPANHILLPSLNYKTKQFNLFSNFRWRYSDYNGNYETDQQTFANGQTDLLEKREDEDRHDDGRSGYLGADYFFDDNNSITAAFFRMDTKDTDETRLDYNILNAGEPQARVVTNGNSVENRDYNQLEANYTKTFEQKGKKWTVDFQYDFWNSVKDWNLATTGEGIPNGIGQELRTRNEASSDDYVLQTDYKQGLGEKGKIQIGLKGENREINNRYLGEVFTDGNWEVYQGIDNDVDYSEQIGAGYMQYQYQFKKLEVLVGVRAEYTEVTVEDQENQFTSQQDYLNWFPTLHTAYQLSDQHTLQLSYSRRINRPSLWNLYPFSEIKDFNLQEIGNPNLQPAYTNGLEFSSISTWEKISFNPTVYYRQTTDPFSRFLESNDQGTFIVKPINIDEQSDLGIEFSLRYQPASFLRLSTEFNFHRFEQSGSYNGESLDANGTNWHVRTSANVQLPKGIRWQVQFNYWGPEQTAQIEYKGMYMLTLGLSKSFWKDRFSVNLRAFNILDSREMRTIARSEGFQIEERRARVGARYSLGMVYKFNQTGRQRMRQARRGNR